MGSCAGHAGTDTHLQEPTVRANDFLKGIPSVAKKHWVGVGERAIRQMGVADAKCAIVWEQSGLAEELCL